MMRIILRFELEKLKTQFRRSASFYFWLDTFAPREPVATALAAEFRNLRIQKMQTGLPKPVSETFLVVRRRITMQAEPGPHAPQVRRRVTISDVADHLQLTKGTVSRALNG